MFGLINMTRKCVPTPYISISKVAGKECVGIAKIMYKLYGVAYINKLNDCR